MSDRDGPPKSARWVKLARKVFRSQVRERLPQFVEAEGRAHDHFGVVLAWSARKRFVAYIAMQLHHRKPGFTIEMGWSRGQVESFYWISTTHSKLLGERKRLGYLMPSEGVQWWWLFPATLTSAQRRGIVRATPTKVKIIRTLSAVQQKAVPKVASDPVLRTQTVALLKRREDEQLRMLVVESEPAEALVARISTCIDDAIEQVVQYGLPWLAARAEAHGTPLKDVLPARKQRKET